ncbi:hypothetical protein BS47DRAFT_1387461 [Hydnum rufescens UP504]|uniref:Uncharacterized protein n=1 Tax=Hydnum rufescens UP504 TaxID=1448309 RepID=A0A9P6BAB4_9AGAM|nr:hypothetical protein BS47DRAFT_1387461 [Hydnum rufescens UP504]
MLLISSGPPAVILQAWGPKDFLTYAREETRGTYYESAEDDTDSEDDAEEGAGDKGEDDAEGNEGREASTSAQPTHSYNLRRQSTVQPAPEGADEPKGAWARSERESPAASNVGRDEDIKTWLESVEEPVGHA